MAIKVRRGIVTENGAVFKCGLMVAVGEIQPTLRLARSMTQARQQKSSTDVRAFTLVELLVVIAIVGVLSALLLPTLARGKSAARRAACTSSQRQLALASQMYWTDNDERLFPYRFSSDASGARYWFGWLSQGSEGGRQFDARQGALFPYLKGQTVAICPEFDYENPDLKLKATGASYGYGYNLHLSPPLGPVNLRASQVPSQSRIALFADAAQVNTFQAPASPDHPMLEEFYYVSAIESTTHFLHDGRANVTFLDGHCEALKAVDGSLDPRLPAQKVGRLASDRLQPGR